MTGTVKWFNVKSGYGFINRNDTKEDVFVHQTAIIKNNPKKAVRSVGDGEVVEFDVVLGDKGNEAANVTGPEGEPVRGSTFAADKRRGFRLWRQRTRRRAPGDEGDENGNDENAEGASDGNQKQRPRRFRPRRGRFGRPRDGESGKLIQTMFLFLDKTKRISTDFRFIGNADDSGEAGENNGAEDGERANGNGRRFYRRNFRGGNNRNTRRKSDNEGAQSDGGGGPGQDGENGGQRRRRTNNPRIRRNRPRNNANRSEQVNFSCPHTTQVKISF